MGGAQTRTLREVYHFIKCQLEFLLKMSKNIYFVNILDGDACFANKDKFQYLMNKQKYNKIKKFIFIGGLSNFQMLFSSI
jgi:hypothetical protein